MVGELELGRNTCSVVGKLAHPYSCQLCTYNLMFVDVVICPYILLCSFSKVFLVHQASHLMKSVPSMSAIRTGMIMVAANSMNPVTNMRETEPESNRVREKRYSDIHNSYLQDLQYINQHNL